MLSEGNGLEIKTKQIIIEYDDDDDDNDQCVHHKMLNGFGIQVLVPLSQTSIAIHVPSSVSDATDTETVCFVGY